MIIKMDVSCLMMVRQGQPVTPQGEHPAICIPPFAISSNRRIK